MKVEIIFLGDFLIALAGIMLEMAWSILEIIREFLAHEMIGRRGVLGLNRGLGTSFALFGSLAPASAGWGFSGWPVGAVASPSLMYCSDWALLPHKAL